MHEQPGILVGIRGMNFTARDTGEVVKGLKLILLKECKDPVRDGYGYLPFDLTDMSQAGLDRVPALAQACRDWYLQEVLVGCDVDLSYKRVRFIPREIRLA